MRKIIIVFAAAAALSAGAGMADARTGGMGGGAGHAMVGGGGIGHGMVGGHFARPMVGGSTRGFSGRAFTTSRAHFTRTAFFHDRFHRFHHRRHFFDIGFAGPFVADTSCWRLIWTGWGWRRVWVCDWPY